MQGALEPLRHHGNNSMQNNAQSLKAEMPLQRSEVGPQKED